MEANTTIICPPDLSSRPLGFKIEKVVGIPVPQLFKAWTSQLDLWFASPGSLLSKIEPNAPFYFETIHAGVRHPHYGRFLEIVEPTKVALTWVTGEGGTEGAETLLTIELLDHQAGAFIRLTHAGFRNEDSKNLHQEAWHSILQVMEERLSLPID
jgi:uncharacterized protein YndB with AHSA1/START domain